MEELNLLESDVIDNTDMPFDVYGADPVFASKQELEEFMANCSIKKGDRAGAREDKVCYEQQSKVKKLCTCGKCQDIWSDKFEHICCQQVDR